ncbi:MAG: hypothetical protein Q8898_12730 [Bacillota bacterium]|nr:hypothetical protein [Bacillota bacterium]
MKKLMLVLMMIFAIVLPSVAEARGFSGHSFSSGSHTRSFSGGTYHSGYKSPSSHVTRTPSYSNSHSTYSTSRPSRTSSFFSHAAAFGAGAFLGHMFHPFGGSYYGGNGYYGSNGFSFFGLLFDILIILIIIRVIKGIFSRRRY